MLLHIFKDWSYSSSRTLLWSHHCTAPIAVFHKQITSVLFFVFFSFFLSIFLNNFIMRWSNLASILNNKSHLSSLISKTQRQLVLLLLPFSNPSLTTHKLFNILLFCSCGGAEIKEKLNWTDVSTHSHLDFAITGFEVVEKMKTWDFRLLHNLDVQFSFSDVFTVRNPAKILKGLTWTHFFVQKSNCKKASKTTLNKLQLSSILSD